MHFRGNWVSPHGDTNQNDMFSPRVDFSTPGLVLLLLVELEFMQSCPTKHLPKATGTATECLGFHQQKYGGYGFV